MLEQNANKKETPKVTKAKKPMGRPKVPDEFKKKHHTVKLRDETWDDLGPIGGGNRARAIEEFVARFAPSDDHDLLSEMMVTICRLSPTLAVTSDGP